MSKATGITIRCVVKNRPLKEYKVPKLYPVDMSTLGAELQADLKRQRRISAFFATAAIAEGILLLCFGLGQMFF